MEENKVDAQKIEKIKSIIEREIEKELVSKQNEVSDISEKIKVVLRNLELLKYVVAVSYYDQNPVLTSKKGQDEESNEDEKVQNQIHPCIKKLLPFQSNYNKSFGDVLGGHSYETRNSKKSAVEAVSGLATTSTVVEIKKETDDSSGKRKCDASNTSKMPQYIPPLPNTDEVVKSVNSARGSGSRVFYRVVVGNVSKWIPPDTREDKSTHKWMVYIRNKDEGKDVTRYLRKVRYFLHESYKPHDIIDVTEPFQLTRRGWGEFPIRVQLHFTHPLNKPVDIIHNLKLDMTCSGIQMLGAETLVEVSLHESSISAGSGRNAKKSEAGSTCPGVKDEAPMERGDVFDETLLTAVNGFKCGGEDAGDDGELNMPDVVIKQEPDDSEYQNPKVEEMRLAVCNSRRFLLDRRKAMRVIEIEHNYTGFGDVFAEAGLCDLTRSMVKLEPAEGYGLTRPFKNGTVLDPGHVSRVLAKRARERPVRLDGAPVKSEEEIFRNLKSVFNKLETETQPKNRTKVFRHMYLVNVLQRAHGSKLNRVEPLIRWFVQRWPIVTKLSLDPMYKVVHPYSCPSEEEYLKYSVGKQRSSEWFRAKAIQKVLKSLKSVIPIEEEIWTTKQILLWSRFHGYVPFRGQPPIKVEPVDSASERVGRGPKWNDSSSDEDETATFDGKLPRAGAATSSSSSKFTNGLPAVEKKRNFKKGRRKDGGSGSGGLDPGSGPRPINYRECNTCTDVTDGDRYGADEFRVLQSANETDIEVVEVDSVSAGSPTKQRETPEAATVTLPGCQSLLAEFVCATARDIGVKIVEEEILPGVKCDSVSRVLSESVSCFLDDLVRKSLAQGWTRNGDRCPESLELTDVLAALIENPRFDVFTNRGMGQEPHLEK